MTAKQYLEQLYYLDKLIKSKEDKISQIRYSAIYSPNNLTGFKGGSQSDKISKCVSKICDLEQRLVKDKLILQKKYTAIINKIDAIEDMRFRLVLTLRYVDFKKWDEIASSLNYELRHVYNLRQAALKAFSLMYGFDD